MSAGLTLPVTLAVLFGALLHASWNVLIKSARDKSLDTALIHVMGCVVGIPLLIVVGLPPTVALPYVAISLVLHVGYYIALAGAYKHGDLSMTYPIMRGFAPLLVAIGSGILVGEVLPLLGWLGVAGVCVGVVLLGFSHTDFAHAGQRSALRFAFANALIIACYTIVDAVGVRFATQHGGNTAQYVALLFVVDGIPYFLIVMAQMSPAQRDAARVYMRGRWPVALVGTFASLGSYGIALWAMTQAPVAMVAALREVSVLFGAVLGVIVLKEKFGVSRAVGTFCIMGGVVLLRIA